MATQVENAPVNIINEKDRDLDEERNKISISERDKDLEELAEERQRLLQGGIAADFRSEPVDSSISLETRPSKKVKLPEDGGFLATGGGRFTIGPAPDEPWEMVPPDGRWGWCILVGATLVNILIPGTIKSFGVLFLEFLEVFNAGQASASGIPALCYFLYSSLGPISSILSVRWSYRTVTLIGGSFAAFGMILSSFAWSIGYLYFSFGVLVGTGAGLSFPPTVYIVTSYFVRLRGLANGICMSGSAFGSIILPPVLRYLLETYGYRGAVLLMGGIMLNVWAAALLFQPVESHLVRRYKEIDDTEGQLETVNEEEIDLPQITTTADSFCQPESILNTVTSSNTLKNKNSFVRSTSAASSNGDLARALSRNKLSQPKITSHNYSNASLALEAVPEGKLGMGSKEFGRKLSYAKPPKRSPSTSSFQYVSTPFHGSTLSAFEPNEFASQFSLKSVTDSVKPIVYCCCCCKKETSSEHPKEKEPNKYFDVSLLRDPTYLVILLSVCSVAISYTNFIILLPSYAVSLKFSKTQGAYLLSIVSAFDLIGRIGGSAISDLNLLPKTWYFVGGLLLSGISLSLLPFFKSYIMCSVMCGVFGLASGTNTGVTTLVMAEKLGTERLMSTYGISLFVNGILQLIGPIICNLWYEQTKSYFLLFITLGIIFIAGSSLWGLMPLISRRKREKEMRLNEHDCSKA